MKKYTFDDWVNTEFIFEKDYDGSPIRNNSGQYLTLMSKGIMTYETLNKIQEAQTEAYKKIIDSTLQCLKTDHKRKSKQTPDLRRKLISDIEYWKKYLEKHPDVYRDIISPVMHRGMRKGAKYVTAYQYREAVIEGKSIDAFSQPTNNEIDGWDDVIHLEYPFVYEWIYCKMEVALLWLKILEEEFEYLDIENLKSLQPINKQKNKLSMREIALICYYSGIQIVDDNNDMIAAKYDYTSVTSGSKLQQWYYKILNKDYRYVLSEKERIDRNQINRLKKVIQHLSVEHKEQAEKELQTLITHFNSYYPKKF